MAFSLHATNVSVVPTVEFRKFTSGDPEDSGYWEYTRLQPPEAELASKIQMVFFAAFGVHVTLKIAGLPSSVGVESEDPYEQSGPAGR